MPIEIMMKEPSKSMVSGRLMKMVPVRVEEIKSMVCTENSKREEEVRKYIKVGDICVLFDDQQNYVSRILHCPSGILVPMYYSDYLLFDYADEVNKVVIAKQENK